MEDLFVLPDERGEGAGKALMSAMARIAIRKGCSQMAWDVLNWNTPAIKFYRRLGQLGQDLASVRLKMLHSAALLVPIEV